MQQASGLLTFDINKLIFYLFGLYEHVQLEKKYCFAKCENRNCASNFK